MSHATQAIKTGTRRGALFILLCAITVGLFPTLAPARASLREGQDYKKLSQFVQASNTPAMKMLREGRDLIDAEQWSRAIEKFTQFVNSFPKDKDVDVALYWLAYSLKKQGNPRESAFYLQRLLKKYPQSAWADESVAMLNEIAGELGEAKLPQETLNTARDNDEIRIIALQSLCQANRERCIAYINDVLKPGSAASPRMKEAAVSILGSEGGPAAMAAMLQIARDTSADPKLRNRAIHTLGEEGGEQYFEELSRLYDAERNRDVKRQLVHAFADMEGSQRAHARLIQIARNAAEDQEMRRQAIHWLGEKRNASAFDDLTQIYNAEQNLEVKKQILHAYSDMEDARARARLLEIARNQSENRELRRQAIQRLGDKDGEAALEDLIKIYQTDRDAEVRRQILRALSEMKNPRARALIVEAARTADSVELRRQAIRALGEQDDAQTLDLLISLYDSETSPDIKRQLLHAFAESKQKRALQKLLDVARRDPSLELRKQAINRLGESKDPEALRLLEELLKP